MSSVITYLTIAVSAFRVYVWPVTLNLFSNPANCITCNIEIVYFWDPKFLLQNYSKIFTRWLLIRKESMKPILMDRPIIFSYNLFNTIDNDHMKAAIYQFCPFSCDQNWALPVYPIAWHVLKRPLAGKAEGSSPIIG